jgi:hypothetical protein
MNAKRAAMWVVLSIGWGGTASAQPPAEPAGEPPVEEPAEPEPASETADVDPFERPPEEAPPQADASVAAEPAPPPAPRAKPLAVAPERQGADDVADEEDAGAGAPHRLVLEFGTRLTVIEGGGFDPYSEGNVLPQALLLAAFVPLHVGPFGFGAAAEYDIGRSEAMARGLHSALTMHRIAAGLHAQAELWRFQLHLRAMAGALHAAASLDAPAMERGLEAANWSWVVDATAGARFRFASAGPERDPAVSFWLLVEAGYSFSGEMDLAMAPPEDDSDPRQFGILQMPALDASGAVTRLAFALSF